MRGHSLRLARSTSRRAARGAGQGRGEDAAGDRGGVDLTGEVFRGRSLITRLRGETIADVEETSIHATIDLTTIQRERRSEPALRLQRPELYLDGAGA
jgi:predicted amidohydrolase